MRFRVPLHFWLATLLLGNGASLPAADNKFDYDEIAVKTFWEALYPEGGWTLYCGAHFTADRHTPDGGIVVIEHVYPTDLMLKFAGCRNRSACRESGNAKFARMEADMHNLYPSRQSLITFRNGRRFGLVAGEDWRFDDCDIEWQGDIFELRPLARGNVARSMLYMQATYGLPIDAAQLQVLRDWNREDPPSKQEKERNEQIERLQGNRNPFIDDPALADRVKPAPR